MSAAVSQGASQENLNNGQPENTAPPGNQVLSAQLFIREYRVEGAHKLNKIEVEEAVYPFLGPGRTAEDVERARAALEKAYREKGNQTVTVQIPPQQAAGGVVVLQVIEAAVGRLRVRGARYYSPRQIKQQAPSLAEGTVPNFNEVTRDIVGLNQLPERRVTPTLRAGVEPNPGGPTPGYDYGRHFLFQGHENSGDLAYVTRINLDVASPDYRVTLLTPPGTDGLTHFNRIDGSTWDPFTQTLLFTQENGNLSGVIEMGADFDSSTGGAAGLRTLYGSLGLGGFEGIHPDDQGNIFIVEDVGGALFGFAKNPNSFVYRFVPTNRADLTQGKLEALQVSIDGQPVVFVPTGDTLSANQLKLHTPGTTYPVKWVTVHDTAVDGTDPFDANALAKAASATPFKRPENGQFQPATNFLTLFFDITGDTDSNAGNDPELAARGAWGGIFRVDFAADKETGTIRIVVLGDADHSSFDNLTFASRQVLLAAEDRGDTLHDELNKLDSIWAYDVKMRAAPARFVALGQDRMAISEDNEPTGLHYSDGDSSIDGLVGRRIPNFQAGRLFFTQQHGENNLYQVVTTDSSEQSGQ